MTPINYSQLETMFGEPGSESNFIKAPFPFTLYLNGDKNMPCRNFYGNKHIYRPVFDSFLEIMDIFGLDYIRENGLDEYGGCYENRKSRGSEKKSVHSWGMAIDYLPSLGKYNEPSLIPYHIVQAFKTRGFIWGGDWENSDGMHFSAVIE